VSDEDRDWLEALQGRAESGTAGREAAALRRALLARPIEPIEPRLAPEARLAKLLERASRARLLRPRSAPWMVWLAGWRGAAVLAVVAVVAIGVGLERTGHDIESETVRNVPGDAWVIESPDPAALREEMVDALTEAGVEAIGFEELGRVGVDAEVELPPSAAVQQVLERYGLPLPPDGVLQIRIVEPRG
jgi:hypothetical protein